MEIEIKAVWLQGDSIFIQTVSGEERSQPLKWFPKLLNASLAERQRFELSPFGIHWPSLDEDLSFEGFFTYSRQLG
ncbi:DUF2442 domain-containing protein [Dyadobacter sp. 50-39]|uniref:DUF2442 domain-containing protein n=1 Tax=Dyadobacter sp. 50-39 TaxID=1895756 RepID=UPI0025BE3E72|nr:DUF2442 domain-containing protein [Dyadobacter sp. 50-39]